MVLRLQGASPSPSGLVRTQSAGPTPRVPDLIRPRWEPPVSGTVVLRLQGASPSPSGLVRTQSAGPTPRVPDLIRLG